MSARFPEKTYGLLLPFTVQLSNAPGWYSYVPDKVHPPATALSTPPWLRKGLPEPNGRSYTAAAVTRYGRPLLFVCQSVGSRSYSSTVRFSVTRLTVKPAFAERPPANRRFSVTSSECVLITPSG